jgi:hypothetical protein
MRQLTEIYVKLKSLTKRVLAHCVDSSYEMANDSDYQRQPEDDARDGRPQVVLISRHSRSFIDPRWSWLDLPSAGNL